MVIEDESISKMVECVKLSCEEKAICGTIAKDYSKSSNVLFIGGVKIIKVLGEVE